MIFINNDVKLSLTEVRKNTDNLEKNTFPSSTVHLLYIVTHNTLHMNKCPFTFLQCFHFCSAHLSQYFVDTAFTAN